MYAKARGASTEMASWAFASFFSVAHKRRKLLEIEFSFAFYLSICRLFECYFLNYKHTANNLYRFLITKKFQFLIFYIDNIIPFSCQDFFSLAINPL